MGKRGPAGMLRGTMEEKQEQMSQRPRGTDARVGSASGVWAPADSLHSEDIRYCPVLLGAASVL